MPTIQRTKSETLANVTVGYDHGVKRVQLELKAPFVEQFGDRYIIKLSRREVTALIAALKAQRARQNVR